MKKNIILSMAGALAAGLLIASCSAKPESVTAVVAGPDGQPAAVVVKYAKAVSAESVTADAFQIEGQEIECVFVTDKDITTPPAKPECDKAKAECDSTKACPEAKAECDKAKAECDGQHKDCAKEAGKAHDCGMDPKECEANNHECCPEEKAQCDSTKTECPEAKADCKGPKSVDGQFVVIVLKKACPEKPACDKAKAECDSTKAACPEGKPEKPACPEIAVPKINVKLVKEIKAADGSAMKAWSKAFPATKAVPCFGPKGPKHHHGEACPEAKAECDKAKAECDGQHKDCPKAEEAK